MIDEKEKRMLQADAHLDQQRSAAKEWMRKSISTDEGVAMLAALQAALEIQDKAILDGLMDNEVVFIAVCNLARLSIMEIFARLLERE